MFPKNSVASVVGIGGLAGGIGAVLMTKLGGKLFDYYGALGQIQTGYLIMFSICATVYLVAWAVLKLLASVPAAPKVPTELAKAS
jgi:ACS family hexuronate transporter-like MFS transporter